MLLKNIYNYYCCTVSYYSRLNIQLKLKPRVKVRQYSTLVKLEELELKYSENDQEFILTTLNTATAEHLKQLNISQNRINSLKTWQTNQGTFKSFSDLLEVEGFGIKILDKLCSSIISNQSQSESTPAISKNRRHFVIPPLNKQLQNFTSAIGLYLGPVGVSWSGLTKCNELKEWDCLKFPEVSKKMLPMDTFNLAQTILKKIPLADFYVFEAPMYIAHIGNKQTIVHNEHLELLSMLLALLNTSRKHNTQLTEENVPNCVYYLRSNLSARLFRTLMGSERVSTTPAVNNLLGIGTIADVTPKISLIFCEELKEKYLSQNGINRELLGQALLLIVTFMEICVHKNVESLAAVTQGKKNGNKNQLN
ncbi:hypothetical protein RI129_011255 [Pyrocoelia pectoralis]|uniref:Transcription elongation factor, mitochondrial n=1 Tax=Pyrocoelia pectoralis TaxID=417401 RepID=A0AAN7VBP3_9COLE